MEKSARKADPEENWWLCTPIGIRNHQESPLFCLPPEVRDLIYEFAFGGNEIKPIAEYSKNSGSKDQVCESKAIDSGRKTQKHFRELMLPATACRQLFYEVTSELFYKVNTFHIECGKTYTSWLNRRTVKQRSAIRTIKIGYSSLDAILSSTGLIPVNKLQQDMPGLQCIVIGSVRPDQELEIVWFASEENVKFRCCNDQDERLPDGIDVEAMRRQARRLRRFS